MKKHIIKVLTVIGLMFPSANRLFAQDKFMQQRISLEKDFQKAKADTLKISILIKLGKNLLDHQKEKNDLRAAADAADRALRLSKSIDPKTYAGRVYELKSSILEADGKMPEARVLQKMAIKYFQAAGDSLMTGDAYRKLGRTYSYQDRRELAERIKLDSISLKCYIKTKQFLKMGYVLESLGDLNHIRNEIPMAISYLNQALVAYDKAKFKSVQGVYQYLTVCYYQTGDLKQALRFGLESQRVAEAVKDSTDMTAHIYNHLGKIYMKLGQLNKAIGYYKTGLAFVKRYHDDNMQPTLSMNLAQSLIFTHKEPEAIQMLKGMHFKETDDEYIKAGLLLYAHTSLKEYQLADRYYQETVRLAATMDALNTTKIFIFPFVIRYLFESRRFDEAIRAIDACEFNYRGNHNDMGIAISHHWRFKLDSAQGKYIPAINHLHAEQIILDSLMNVTKVKSIAQMEIQYETEKKEQQLLLKNQNIQLLTKQGQLQKASLENAALIRNITIGGAIILIILLLITYSRYQIKQRSHLHLQEQQSTINKKNHTLEALVNDKDSLLQEKEWLLKEIHHRVKNNLQIVISLLNSQSCYLDNDAALSAIRESQHRMHSISLIHQKLYQSDNLARIDMVEYIIELTNYLKGSFDGKKNVKMVLEIEPVSMDVAQAVPVGLIINEAVTNAFKYAFRAGNDGVIMIALEETESGFFFLTISDNGPGLTSDFDINQCNSLGMSLMKGLSHQLNGQIELFNSNGLTLRIKVPVIIPVIKELFVLG
ncbi:hypothetical protein IDJ75_11505 [Mucilaginibacter rigui]|uniref:histidine kinase n=1 Tax=Mucilaginibacter rigui TaxID=534635 RepID=A0ABR7X5P6_9SPHI|nr:histidine kinase dimerization/phosphoacceptor domain -containing protein [Mucilaginibacter rigui]MBD1385908.1 hypothetical protein [Mucilaginibacter rigui]